MPKAKITKPRYYQFDVIKEVKTSLKAGIVRQLIVLATGLGKTVIAAFMHIMVKSNEKTLFIVDSIELARQTKKTIKEVSPGAKVGIEMNTSYASTDDDFVILSVDTWGRTGSTRIERFDPDHFGKIVVDEAHISPTPRYERVLNYFGVSDQNLKDDRLLLGMTATPNRTDNVGLGKVYDDMTAKRDLIWGIREGWLVEPVFYSVDTDIDLSQVKTKSSGDFKDDDLSFHVNVSSRNEKIVKSYEQHMKDRRCVVYCASVDHAYELAEMFRRYGWSAETISAKTKKKDRKKYVEGYKNGEIDVLTNYGTLTKGFDSTEMAGIIMARPIQSELLYQQVLGRGLRPSKTAMVNQIDAPYLRKLRLEAIENSKKPICKVIDFVDNYGKHKVCTPPQLFGLNDELDVQGKKMYKDVVEPLEEAQLKHGIDIEDITDLDQVEVKIKQKQRISIESLETPKDIQSMSNHSWSEVGKYKYELTLSNEGVAIMVRLNKLDRWELSEIDLYSNDETKLNRTGFGSLEGAIKVGDDYAKQNYDIKFQNRKAKWRKKGVTDNQFEKIRQIFKPEINDGILEFDQASEYKDTRVPFIYLWLDGEWNLLKRGTAHELLNNFFANAKRKKAEQKA